MIKHSALKSGFGLAVLGLFWLTGLCFAQSPEGRIVGTVRDGSGSLVPNAVVSIQNEETGLVRNAHGNAYGEYEFPSVPIGSYTVTADADGFRRWVDHGFRVHVAQDARLDVVLDLGAVGETVNVTADAPVIHTDDSSVSNVVTEHTIVSLPLNGRDYTQLAALSPGVVYAGNNGWSSQVSMNGNRADKTEFLVDGTSNTETWYGGALLSPSLDGIEEFRVQTSMSPAEYGYGSGFVNVITKSGTNQFHGDAFDFLRNDAMDARNFFALSRPELKRNQFGGTVGGPIKRNSIFFYVDYEGTEERQDSVTDTMVPDAAMRNGDFSGQSTILMNPSTGAPFAGNQIPNYMISSIAQYFQKDIPLPNAPGNQFIVNTPAPVTQKQFSGRVDKQSDKTTIAARYTFGTNYHQNSAGGQIYGPTNPIGETNQTVDTHNVNLNINRILTPNLLLNVRGGYYYNYLYQYTPSDQGPNADLVAGIQGFEQTTASLGHGGFPYIYLTGYGGIPGGVSLDIKPKEEVQTYATALSWVKGKHTAKFGFELRRELGTTQHYDLAKGEFVFTGLFSGDPYADFLLGFPNDSSRSYPLDESGSRTLVAAFYAQDDWKVSQRLTVNAGVRFEFNPFPTPLRSGSVFDPALDKVVLAARNGVVDFYTQIAPYAYAADPSLYVLSSAVGKPFSLVSSKGGIFNPRLGLAWRPFGGTDTVIRVGGGLFTIPIQQQIGRGGPTVNPPWDMSEFKYVSAATPWATFWPSGTDESAFSTPLVTAMDDPYYNAYSAQWNVLIERKLARDMSLSIGYVGSKATHLELNDNLNQPQYGPNSWNEVPFPQFGTFSQDLQTRGNSNYNALQIQVERRYSNGLSFLSSYSWSKDIDYSSDDTAFIADRFNLGVDRGLSALDTGNRWVTSFSYDLPFGNGRHWFTAGTMSKAMGGWALTGIATLQSGTPFSVYSPVDTSGFFVMNGQRADRIGNGTLSNPTVNDWFDLSAFTQGTQYTVGTAGRNILRGDGTVNFDLGINRNFSFKDRYRVQFRGETFNAFNHPTFGIPFNTIGEADSGRVTSASAARTLQVGLKMYF